MIKKLLMALLLLMPTGAVFAVVTDWAPYCPVKTPQGWEYKFTSKKENKQKDNIQAFMNRTENIEGIEYFVYEVPSRRMYYYLTKDPTGIYVKTARVCLPVLEFLNMNITFNPPVCVLKFPIVKGEEWRYDGLARVHIFAVIDIEKTLTVRFKMYGPEYLTVAGRKMRVFHLFALASRKWEEENPISGDAWFGKYLGVVRAETKNSLMELVGYTNK